MSKANKEVKEEVKEVKRFTTSELLKSNNVNEKLAGISRLVGEVVKNGTEEKAQTVANRMSRAGKCLIDGTVSEEQINEAKELVNKCWDNIKEGIHNKKLKPSEDTMKLYALFTSLSKKDKFDFVPDEIKF